MSNAREIFHNWQAGGYAYAHAQVAAGATEGTFLEFKRLVSSGPKLEEPDRQNLAKSVSGFANAGGGVLIWGVATQRDADDSMRARGIHPISGLQTFLDSVRSLATTLIVPPVDGIEYAALEEPDSPGRGLLVMMIPAVDGAPVLAKGPKQTTFYLRNDLGTAPMEHWQIADRFQRRPQAQLRLALQVWRDGGRDGSGGPHARLHMVLGVFNCGRGIALHPTVAFILSGPITLPTVRAAELVRRDVTVPPGEPPLYRFSARGAEAAYPNGRVQAGMVSFEVPVTGPAPEPVSIRYWLDCDGAHASGTHVIASADLDRLRLSPDGVLVLTV